MTKEEIEELVRRLQKEQQPVTFKEKLRSFYAEFPWRHVILGCALLLCFMYLFYDRKAKFTTENGVVLGVLYVIGQIIGYYTGSSKDQSDKAKVEAAKVLNEPNHNPNV